MMARYGKYRLMTLVGSMKGVSLYKISKFLGHSSVTMTEKHYAGLVPETLPENIEKLGS